MKDYTKELGFWKRLESFVSDIQVNDPCSEEEQEMIMHCCKLKILDLQNVTHSEAAVCLKAKHQYRAKYRNFKYCPDCGCKLQTDG